MFLVEAEKINQAKSVSGFSKSHPFAPANGAENRALIHAAEQS